MASWRPLNLIPEEEEIETQTFVNNIFSSIPTRDQRLEEVRQAQKRDRECSQIIDYCLKDHWPDSAKRDLRRFYVERHSLTVVQDTLLHGNRLVIPQTMRSEMLGRIHQGHQGIVKCRALARSCIWWPGMSKDIGLLVEGCSFEKIRQVPPQPLIPTPTPDYAWQQVASDLFEYLGEHYLLVVDYYSRRIEISHLKSLTSSSVINSFKAIFARMGIPERVITDNGTQ